MTFPLRKGPSGPPVADADGNAPGQLWYFNGSIWLPTGRLPSPGRRRPRRARCLARGPALNPAR